MSAGAAIGWMICSFLAGVAFVMSSAVYWPRQKTNAPVSRDTPALDDVDRCEFESYVGYRTASERCKNRIVRKAAFINRFGKLDLTDKVQRWYCHEHADMSDRIVHRKESAEAYAKMVKEGRYD